MRIASVILVTQRETKYLPEDSKHMVQHSHGGLVLGRGNGIQPQQYEQTLGALSEKNYPMEHST